ncbi:unnamed protein product [Gongylonema pulchrum]|uniref:Protein kinase domain-containing protein n=1 Tax=Gongylonema pulchrum TaxID=637853 RepID=A0A183DSQ8_9BILA|nr:unnamed protein product [Gongylonema pulchrum]
MPLTQIIVISILTEIAVEDEQLPFEIKDVVRIRANEKFSKYYECMDELGEGKFGKVYRCREKATGLQLAAKRIKIKRDADREKVEREVAIMTQLRHPRITQIYDAFATPENDVVLVMEIVNGGELFDRVVDENYILTEMAVVMIVCQLCEAISYIHSKNIVHLDIKVQLQPENIMCVSHTGNRIKLIDFGLAQFYDGSSNLLFMAGTPEFVAPEVIKFEPIDFHTDMWSVGVITYILLSGISPFLGETLGDTYVAVEKGEWEFDDEAFEAISPAAKDFISKLLIMDQSYNNRQRMLPNECLNHPWIVGSRAKAANDLILNAPNVGVPLSKEGLKSYLRNKRFRKATWALVFLIRFKRQTLMNYGRQKIAAPVVELCNDHQLEEVAEIGTEEIASTADTAVKDELVLDERKISIDIPITVDVKVDESTLELQSPTLTKYPEEKLSSEIPKKKLRESKGGDKVTTTKKKARKHKERSAGKSDEISSRPKKLHKKERTKTPSDQLPHDELKKQSSTTEVTIPEAGSSVKMTEVQVDISKEPVLMNYELCTGVGASEVAQPLVVSFPGPSLAESSGNEMKKVTRRKGTASPSYGSRSSQELTTRSGSMSKLSGINKKGSSVAAILSMFSEKAEQEARRFERRPSRQVRTFRDVEKPSSRKASLAPPIPEDEAGFVKRPYRAPEEDKERVKNLIELHRRGSADRKQVNIEEIVAVKHEEILQCSSGLKKRESETLKSTERKDADSRRSGQEARKKAERRSESTERRPQATEGKNAFKRKAKRKESAADAEKSKINESGVVAKVIVPGLPVPKSHVVVENKLVAAFAEESSSKIAVPQAECNYRNGTPSKKSARQRREQTDGKQDEVPSTKMELLGNRDPSLTSLQRHHQAGLEGKQQVCNAVVDSKLASSKEVKDGVGRRKLKKTDEARNAFSVGLMGPESSQKRENENCKNTDIVIEKKTAYKSFTNLSKARAEKQTLKEQEIKFEEGSQNTGNTDTSENAGNSAAKKSDSTSNASAKLKKFVAPEAVVKSDSAKTRKLKESAVVAKGNGCSLLQRAASSGNICPGHSAVEMETAKAEGKTRALPRLRPLPSNTGSVDEIARSSLAEGEDLRKSTVVSLRKPPKAPELRSVGERKLRVLEDRDKTNSERKTGSTSLPNATTGESQAQKSSLCDATLKRKSSKRSFQKNSLMKIRSEINLAEHARKALTDESDTTCLQRKALDDEATLKNRMAGIRQTITVASLKHHENFSFGWLKLQLESRVNKEREEQAAWRPRRDPQISPLQVKNAQKALSIWKSMEQRFISNT